MLQSLPLGLDAEDCLHDPAGDHECGTDEIAEGDLGDVPRTGGILNQGAEEQRPRDATSGGTDRIKEGDAQCSGLEREDLADREVGRARARRGEEEEGTQAQVVVGASGPALSRSVCQLLTLRRAPEDSLHDSPGSARHPTVVGKQVRGLPWPVSEQLCQAG